MCKQIVSFSETLKRHGSTPFLYSCFIAESLGGGRDDDNHVLDYVGSDAGSGSGAGAAEGVTSSPGTAAAAAAASADDVGGASAGDVDIGGSGVGAEEERMLAELLGE